MAAESQLNPTQPVNQQIYRILRRDIVHCLIPPGTPLSEKEVSVRFDVSRQPVREAFIKLAESGLVRVLPQRGTLVVKISVAAVEDARFVREAIECAVAREAARRADRVALASVRACLDETERAIHDGDGEHLFALDEEFHHLLAAAAGRAASWNVVEEQKAQMDRVRYLDIGDAIPMKTVFAQHLDILAAVERGDERAAEKAMRVHLSEILVSLPKLAARWPDLFEDRDLETVAAFTADARRRTGESV